MTKEAQIHLHYREEIADLRDKLKQAQERITRLVEAQAADAEAMQQAQEERDRLHRKYDYWHNVAGARQAAGETWKAERDEALRDAKAQRALVKKVQRVLERRIVRCRACGTPHVHYCMHITDPDKCSHYRCNPACKEVRDALVPAEALGGQEEGE